MSAVNSHLDLATTPDTEFTIISYFKSLSSLATVNWLLVTLNLLFVLLTVCLFCKRDIHDEFIRKAILFLLLAQTLRLTISTMTALQNPQTFDSSENVPLQQIYFEVPYYAFFVVSLALSTSWYQLYIHVNDFIHGIDY